jgi:uncharacterized membrane protein YdbT with pleckstrin-like domain
MAHTRLMSDEQPIALTRQHWSIVAPWIAAGVLVFVAVVVVLALLPVRVGSSDIGGLKTLIDIIVAVLVVLWAGFHFLRWRMQTYLLTDRRIVVDRGVLSRYTESISLDRIQNTVIRRPLGDRLIGAGDVEIESAGRDGVEVLTRIPNAQHFYTELLEAMERLRGGQAAVPPQQHSV